MVGINVNRELASEMFEYGNHEIVIDVHLKFTNLYSHHNTQNYSLSLYDSPEGHYVRIVKVRAKKDGTTELSNQSIVVLDAEEEVSSIFGGDRVKNKVINVRDHIGDTARPVFEKLDELYTFTTEGESIEIDVATHEVKAETSWVEVEDEMDRLSREIEALTSPNEDSG